MISLPNLLKRTENEKKVETYQFHNEYNAEELLALRRQQLLEKAKEANIEDLPEDKKDKKDKKETEYAKERKKLSLERERWEKQWAEEEKEHKKQLEKMRQDAEAEIQQKMQQAEQEAEQLRQAAKKEGYEAGFAEGEKEGKDTAYAEIQGTVGAQSKAFLAHLRRVADETAQAKEDILREYKDELKELAITVAEKVIQVSLRSSGEIIEKMILSPTERMKTKEWVKVYISKVDAEMLLEADLDIVQALSHLSEHIKVVSMGNEKQGTCIIEFPDEIIDASVSTQMENIKEILSHSST